MSEPNPGQSVRDIAVEWLIRVQSDAATGDDWSELTDWLDQSPAHLAAYEQAEQLSNELDMRAPDITAGLSRSSAVFKATSIRRHGARVLPAPLRVGAIAASIAFATLVSIAALWMGYQGPSQSFQAARGEVRLIRLDDGSQVLLNADTTLTVHQGWGARRATLKVGEASFDVTKDPKRPFLVTAGEERVRVIGTAFNISHYDSSVEVTVRRGIVEVWPAAMGRSAAVRLVKGQAVRQSVGAPPASPQTANTDVTFAWTEGKLVCDNRPLSDIITDLNRHFKVPIRLLPSAATKRFSGVLVLDEEDDVVRRLAAYSHLTVDRKTDEIILG